MHRLTDPAVKNASRVGLLADGGGLYLSVTAKKTGGFARSWVVRFTAPDGRRREMGLGPYPEVSLAAARRQAAAKRELARNGTDPLEAKKEARRAAERAAARSVTFRHCAEAYITANEAKWRSGKHAKQWRATLSTYAYPIFGDWPVGAIDTPAVARILDPIWSTKTETARRVRGRVEAVLDWATVRGHREGPNPARWRGHLDKALPVIPRARRVKHFAALPFDELPRFMATLEAMPGEAARALEFLIVTAARTGEVLGARWPEINLNGAVWTIPAHRMKAGREHRIPLCAPAVKLLRRIAERYEPGKLPDHVFVGPRGGALSNMALLMTLRRMGRADLTAHGFRSTFRTWTAERTGFPREVAEAALAHVIADHTEAAYHRGNLLEKRRKLMNAWGGYCCGGALAASAAHNGPVQ